VSAASEQHEAIDERRQRLVAIEPKNVRNILVWPHNNAPA